jgi:hypothetical protein
MSISIVRFDPISDDEEFEGEDISTITQQTEPETQAQSAVARGKRRRSVASEADCEDGASPKHINSGNRVSKRTVWDSSRSETNRWPSLERSELIINTECAY